MDKAKAKDTLRNISRYGNIATTKHTRQRMLQRGVSLDDIRYVLEWGKITKLREDTKRNNWKCQIQGKDLDEDELVIQAAFIDELSCLVITVHGD